MRGGRIATIVCWAAVASSSLSPVSAHAEQVDGDRGDGSQRLECTAEDTIALGAGTSESARALDTACPRGQWGDHFDVRIVVDAQDAASVEGLGRKMRLELLDLRTSNALLDQQVYIDAESTRVEKAVQLCRALDERGVSVRLAESIGLREQQRVQVLEPRRAYQLTRIGNQWVNLSEKAIEVDALGKLRRVPFGRYGDEVATVLERLSSEMDGADALVLVDREGELQRRVTSLDISGIEAPIYYVEGGYQAWSAWRRMNRRVARAHASAGRPKCGDG